MIINNQDGSIGRYALIALAWGLGRPIEEVVAAAFGFASRAKINANGDLIKIAELQQHLVGDDKKFFTRQIRDLAEDMQKARDKQLSRR